MRTMVASKDPEPKPRRDLLEALKRLLARADREVNKLKEL